MVALRQKLITASLATLALLPACATHAPRPNAQEQEERPRIEVLAWALIPPEHDTFGTVGGLSSALFREHAQYNEWDQSWTTAPVGNDRRAMVEFVTDSPNQPRSLHALLALNASEDGYDLAITLEFETDFEGVDAIDAEGITRLPRPHAPFRPGELYACTFESPPTVMVREYAPAKRWQVRQSVAELPEGLTARIRPNRAFEAVTLREPNELWVATESAIEGDGPEASRSAGTRCLVLRSTYHTGGPNPLEEFAFYETNPMPPHIGPTFAIHSLVEFEALPTGEILALERSLTLPAGYAARLYAIDGTTRDTGSRLPTLNKSLVADIKALARDAGLTWIGNLEGLALGPTIAELTGDTSEQGRLLLLVADDNFGADIQRTGSQVIALRINDVPPSTQGARSRVESHQ